jgi:acid phosphatase class B
MAHDFKFAFRVIDSESGITLDDRTYVKWSANFVEENFITGDISNQLIGMHVCRKDDFYTLFEPVERE